MAAKPLTKRISLESDLSALRRADLSLSALIDRAQARFEAVEPAS